MAVNRNRNITFGIYSPMEISIKLEYARRVCNCIGLEAKEAVVESPRMEKKRCR